MRANNAPSRLRIDGASDAKNHDGNLDRTGDRARPAGAAGGAGECPVQVGWNREQGPERGCEKESRRQPIQGRHRAAAGEEIRPVAEYALTDRGARIPLVRSSP